MAKNRVRLLAVLAIAALHLGTPVPVADAAGSTIRLDGVTVSLRPRTEQVITVNRTTGTHARVVFWVKADGRWAKRATTSRARIGYAGLVAGNKRRQGSGTTPLGTYALLSTFGTTVRDPSWDLPHRRIRPRDYWVQDNASTYYNRYRNRSEGGFRWWLDRRSVNGSERLAATPREYELSVVIAYNYFHQVRYRGAGIFLHINGPGATAGCVSVPRRFLYGAVTRLRPEAAPVIAIGR